MNLILKRQELMKMASVCFLVIIFCRLLGMKTGGVKTREFGPNIRWERVVRNVMGS